MNTLLPPDLKNLLEAKTLKNGSTKTLFSKKSALVYKAATCFYRNKRMVSNYFKKHTSKKIPYLDCIIARHQSLLLKKLGDNNEHLQNQKIINLKIASAKIDQIVIEPGQTFSYWYLIGKPKVEDGFVKGMLLSRGQVVEGIGGGLCQLSNLLYWLFLHAPVEVLERYHHSYDVFPDSGRIIPFGSGATVFYNYVDLVVRNISKYPLQLKLWLTDKHLKGQILADHHTPEKYSVREENHLFLKWNGEFFRYNELFRDIKVEGKVTNSHFITRNFAPVLYPTSTETLLSKGYVVNEI